MALTDKLTAIANEIRAKTGKTAKMTMAEMATEIGNISSDVTTTNSIINRYIRDDYVCTAGTIGFYAFYGCKYLTSIVCSSAVMVQPYAFANCTKLASADFGVSIESFGECAFNSDSALKTVVIRNPNKVVNPSTTNGVPNGFNNTPIASGTGYIYVPDSLVDSYKAATKWSTYAAQIKPLSEYTGG